jgi:hypothetical protein
MNVSTARERIDKLIKQGKSQFLKPVMIAEILRLHRLGELDLAEVRQFKGRGFASMREVASTLFKRHIDLNWEYVGGVFTDDKFSPATLQALAAINTRGQIESYIYFRLEARWQAFRAFLSRWLGTDFRKFDIHEFIRHYESMEGLGNARGKLYEVVIYALFTSIVQAVDAKVQFILNPAKLDLLDSLAGFASTFFDLKPRTHKSEHPARIFRAGRTHASDSGIDMWANFGPVIQVKHQTNKTFEPKHARKIIGSVRCDRLVIICRHKHRKKVAEFAELLQAESYVRILDEEQIVAWYDVIFAKENLPTIGQSVHAALIKELRDEFPIPPASGSLEFRTSRGYESVDWPT